jgi:drug/metabolite transporter (DMT)-like permease
MSGEPNHVEGVAGSGAPKRLPPRALAMLAVLTVVWGATWPVMKIGLLELPIFTYRSTAVLAGAIAMFVIARRMGYSLRVPVEVRIPLITAALLYIGALGYFSSLALTLIGSGQAAIVAYTMPLWAFVFGVAILRERPSPIGWLGLVAGIAGVGLLAGRGSDVLGDVPQGVAAQLAGAIVWGYAVIINKRTRWGMPLLSVTAWQLLIGGLALAIPALGEVPSLGAVSIAAVGSVLYLGLLSQGACNWMWFRIIEMVPASVAGMAILAVPATSLALGAVMLDEPITWVELTALGLVISALLTVMPLPRRRSPGHATR